MTEIVGACLSQFHDDPDSFEFLLAFSDGREFGHLVTRSAAQRIAAEFATEFPALTNTSGDDEAGPFHVSRSSDGEREWFSARDAASGVSIPLETRDRAAALVNALNGAFSLHVRLTARPQSAAVRDVTDDMISAARKAYSKATGCDDIPHVLDGWIEDALRASLEAALHSTQEG